MCSSASIKWKHVDSVEWEYLDELAVFQNNFFILLRIKILNVHLIYEIA